jgi:drug/metabolite transporter (DMT)-like permease
VAPRTTGLVLVALSAVCFGLIGIFARIAYDHGANVAGVIAGRAAIILPLIVLLALRGERSVRRRREARLAAPQLLPMALLVVWNGITYFVAVDRMSPALVTLLIYVYPAVTVIGSRLLGWTTLGGLAVLATLLTLTGVVLTLGLPDGTVDPLAAILAISNGCSYAVFLLLAQAALRKTDSLTTYAVAAGLGSGLLLVGSFAAADPAFSTDAAGILAILGAGIVSSVLATLLQFGGLRRLGSAPTALVASLEIVTVVTATAVIYDQPIGAGIALGAVLVTLGAALAPVAVRPREARSTEAARRSRARVAASAPRSPRG